MRHTFAVIPSVVINDGRAQRATPAQPEDVSPIEAARYFTDQGAGWLHIVDTDLTTSRTDRRAVTSVVRDLHRTAVVEVAGGIGDEQQLATALATKCARAVIDLRPDTDPDWLRAALHKHGPTVALAVDVDSGGQAQGGPFGSGSATDLLPVLADAGAQRFIVTDREQAQHWWNHVHTVEHFGQWCEATDVPIVARGQVRGLEDLHALAELAPLGLEGVIFDDLWRASIFTYAEAHAAVAERYDPWEWGPAPA